MGNLSTVNASAPLASSLGDGRTAQPQEKSIATLRQHPYAHRCYMALAGSMFTDEAAWPALSPLMPKAHQEHCQELLARGETGLLMRAVECHPLMGAYGRWRSGHDAPLEWDIWIDRDCPADLSLARVTHGNNTTRAIAGRADIQQHAVELMRQGFDGSDVHLAYPPLVWLERFKQGTEALGVNAAVPALYLDIKSGWSTAGDINAFVESLHSCGVSVAGVLSFKPSQLENVAKRLELVHGVGGLAQGARDGRFDCHRTVLFNGGDLLRSGRLGEIDLSKLRLVEEIQQRHELTLGIYLQEDGCGPQQLDLLTRIINDNPRTFALGMAYGGLPGAAEASVGGDGVTLQTPNVFREWDRYHTAMALSLENKMALLAV